MELHTTDKRIGLTAVLFDEVDERPVDCDVMLPDFLPDVAAVLKCTMRPVVQTHQISGDRVLADGTVYLQVLYLDEERKRVHSFDLAQPFTSAFTVKGNGDTVTFTAKPNYVNCRATGPRRLDIHGACSIGLQMIGRCDTDILEAAEGDGLYTKDCAITYTAPAGSAEKSFTVNEVLELPGVAECVLRNEASAVVSDCKQLPDKAVVKGDLFLKTVYVADAAGTLCQAKNRIPFSQILDVAGLTEQTLCEVNAVVLSCDTRLSQNPNGDCNLLSVSVKIGLSLHGFEQEHATVLEDAFHTAYPLLASAEHLSVRRVLSCRQENVTARETVELPDSEIAEILDLWSEVTGTEHHTDRTATVQLAVSMLTRDTKGLINYYERPCTVSVPVDADGHVALTATVTETEGAVNGNRLELRFVLLLCCRAYTAEEHTAITALQMGDAPHPCTEGLENCQVKVCFAEAGESVWEIAKHRHTSPELLKAENNLTDDVLKQRTMLLIPLA